MDGNMKMKTYNNDQVLVVNHESNTIYNDVVKFNAENLEQAVTQFNTYPKEDATILIRGSDGQVLMRKGVDTFIG